MCTGLEGALFGSAATGATATAAATAATTGLVGAGGAFALAPTLMTAGTVLGTAGALSQGQQQKAMYEAQAQQTKNAAAYSEYDAKQQAKKIREAGQSQVGAANASLAASGVKLGEGTALEISKSITEEAEEDALSAIISGKRSVSSAETESRLLQTAGSNAVTSSYYTAGANVLRSGAYYGSGWRR